MNPASPARVRSGAPRLALALFALVWLGAHAWPLQIDDQFITLELAHNWAATGLVRWSTGEVVEAASSFLQLTLAAGWIALGGFDAGVFVKLVGIAAGATFVVSAAARAPRTAAGTLLLYALVAWEPTSWWTFGGMETSLYGLLLAVGWSGVFGAPPGAVAGVGALWLAATAHPEGNAHFLLGAALAARTSGRPRAAALAGVGALAAYHALRVGAYGALLPTPYLVKIASNTILQPQLAQLARDGVTLSGVALALLVAVRVRPIALLPLAIQLLVVLRAEPDWMGHGRQLLPGVWATVLAACALGTPRSPGRTALYAVGAVALAASLLDLPDAGHAELQLRSDRPLTPPTTWLRSALDTPMLEDVVWIIEGTPHNGAVLTEDVGMVGNIPDIRLFDLVGLATRDIALAGLDDATADARLVTRFAGPDRPALVRRMRYASDELPRPVPWISILPRATPVEYPQGVALRYRLTRARPTADQIRTRWAGLYARYPAQGPLAWHLAQATAAAGELPRAAAIAEEALARFPTDALLTALPASLFFPFPLEDYTRVPFSLRQISRPLRRADAPRLALRLFVHPPADDGQLVHLQWSCGGPSAVVAVHDVTTTPLPAWSCDSAEARLQVEVLDGRPKRPLAEWLYVGIAPMP